MRAIPSRESREYWLNGRGKPRLGDPAVGFDLERLRACMAARCEPADPAVECIRSTIDGIPCEWVAAPGADPDLRLLYLHGGGYVSGCGAGYLPLAAEISSAARCVVLLPDYRLAPEHPFPAGLEDAVAAYERMLGSGPRGPAPARAAFIAGDSAGGGLTLATLLALRDRGRPLPKGGIPLSAFADLTLSSESIAREAENELFMHPDSLIRFVELYAGRDAARDPLVSPVFGDYTGLPPLLIQAGEYEVIGDDSVRVAAKARADGVDVTLEIDRKSVV